LERAQLAVVEHEGRFYLLDGHHRLAAARLAGLAHVAVRDVTQELLSGGFKSYKTLQEVLDDAALYQGDRLNPYKLR
jgi:hypothetical protein